MPKVINKINLKLRRGQETESSDPYSLRRHLRSRCAGLLKWTLDTNTFGSRRSGTFPFGLFFGKKSPAKETGKNFEMKVNSISKFNYYINKQTYTRNFAFVAIFTLFILGFLTLHPIVPKLATVEGTAGVEEIPTITITSSSNIASLEIAPESSDGTFAVSTTDQQVVFTVNTNNYTGYTLNIKTVPTDASDDGSKLINSDAGTTIQSITAATDADTFKNGATETYVNRWGYQPSVFNSTTNTNFLPAPTTEESKLDETSRSGSKSYTIGLGARVDYLLVPGTYTHTYTLVATANPVAYAINYYNTADPTTGTTTAIATQASSVNTSANITLNPEYKSGSAPTRTYYTFRAWCDGTVNSTLAYDTTNKAYNQPATVCNGTEYATGASLPIDPVQDNTGIELFAVWEPISFNDAYKANGKSTYSDTGLYAMQDMNKDICNAVAPLQYGTLVDNRDKQAYTIGKLEDGRCWMADNLNFDAYAYKSGINADNTHIEGTIGATALAKFNGTNTQYSTSDRYATSAINGNSTYVTNGNWNKSYSYSDPLINRSGKCDPAFNSDAPCLSQYQNTDYTHNTVISIDNIGPGNYRIGTYYNFCTASLGSYCYGNGTSADPSSSGNSTDADICPANWRLPVGGASGEFQALATATQASHSSTYQTASSPLSLQAMLSTPLSGDYHTSTAWVQGIYGYFWSSAYANGSSMYRTLINSTGVYPQNINTRRTGASVRCIASS